MKKVFTHSSVIPCDLIVSVLDAAGIPAVIHNELGSAASGYSIPVRDNPSLPWAWPEVWVDEADYELALELVRETTAETSTRGEAGIPTDPSGTVGI